MANQPLRTHPAKAAPLVPSPPDLKDVAEAVADATPPRPVQAFRPPLDVRSAALTVIAALAGIAALHFAEPVLVPVAFGLLISYALDPLVTTLTRWRVPRGLAATLVLSALVGGGVYLGYSLRDDAAALAEQLPRIAERVRGSLREMRRDGTHASVAKVQQAASTIETAAAEAAKAAAPARQGVTKVQIEQPPLKSGDLLVTGSLGMLKLAAQVVLVFFLALYLLASGDLFKRKLVNMAGSFSEKKITVQILNEIDRQVAAFLLIRFVVSAIVAVATWLPLRALGLEQAGLWGILAGVLNVVPYLGPTVHTVGVSVAAFLQFGDVKMVAAAGGSTILVGVLEGYLLTPLLTGRAARMNAVAVFLGLLFWGWIWGLAGLLLAVPLVMAIKSVCDRVEELKPIGELLGE